MIGLFNYHKNCSLVHCIPQGEARNGYPVIVFPPRNGDVVAGETYEFSMMLTRDATYTIDGQVYRVAHAAGLRSISGKHGDVVDVILHSPPGRSRERLSEVVGDEVTGKLMALRARLAVAK